MRLGYIRIREGGPPEDVQRRSLAAADVSSQHALYGDGTTTVHQRRNDPNDSLAQRSWALRHLRPGDELVVYDAATLGTSEDDIRNVLTIIDERHATLYVIESQTTYLWLRQADEVIALAVNGIKADTIAARSKGGSTKILTAEMHARALELWSDPNIRPAEKVASMLQREFDVKISVQTLQKYLPNRTKLLRSGYAMNGQRYPLNNQTMITDPTPRRMRLKSIPPDLLPGLPVKDQEAIQNAVGKPVILREGDERSVLDHPRTEVEFRVGDVIHTIWVRPSDLEEMS